MSRTRILAATAVASVLGMSGAALAQSGDVNVYTYRETKLVQPLFDAFTKDTGIKVNVVSASSGLEQRIKAEGANSPADVLLTVDIGRIVGAAWDRLSGPYSGAALDLRVGAAVGTVEADPTLLDQLVTNLLENALRHGGGGEVTVEVRADTHLVLLTVHDEGPGIAPELRERLFDPFQAAGVRAGRGVGLAICRAIAEAHGGTLTLGTPSTGTTFRVLLPR